VIDKKGRQIFKKQHLVDDEIPKIFTFTSFNELNTKGEYDHDSKGFPILKKDSNSNLIDKDGRIVNSLGYLIDSSGNIFDNRGK
jgi:hypothetical protein